MVNPILIVEDSKDFQDTLIEQTYKQAEKDIVGKIEKVLIERAHTYGSENAHVYRAYDRGQEDMKRRIIKTLTPNQ